MGPAQQTLPADADVRLPPRIGAQAQRVIHEVPTRMRLLDLGPRPACPAGPQRERQVEPVVGDPRQGSLVQHIHGGIGGRHRGVHAHQSVAAVAIVREGVSADHVQPGGEPGAHAHFHSAVARAARIPEEAAARAGNTVAHELVSHIRPEQRDRVGDPSQHQPPHPDLVVRRGLGIEGVVEPSRRVGAVRELGRRRGLERGADVRVRCEPIRGVLAQAHGPADLLHHATSGVVEVDLVRLRLDAVHQMVRHREGDPVVAHPGREGRARRERRQADHRFALSKAAPGRKPHFIATFGSERHRWLWRYLHGDAVV